MHGPSPKALAEDPETPADTLAELGNSDDIDIVIALVRNPSTPADTLRALDSKWHDYERSPRFLWGSFPLNPNCPSDILKQIADHTVNENTARMAREHPNFPTGTQPESLV